MSPLISLFLSSLLTIVAMIQANSVARWDWQRGSGNKTAVTSAPYGSSGTFARLTTADADMISNEPPQSPYFSDWNRLVSGYGSQRCYKIPREMKLCHNIGYDLMVLPNSLEHEAMDEVITQSEVWLTLVNLGCHDELERFLCSLYAPVCIPGYHEKLIQPCRELCESVRAACLPTMTTFGLGWPDIVKCSKFPQAPQELCIPPNKQRNKTIILNPETRCSGCVDKPTYESAIGSFCTADVVIRAKVLDVVSSPSSSGQNVTHSIRTAGRLGAFKMPKTVTPGTNLDFRMGCDCPIIKAALTRPNGAGRWLIMGKLKEDGRTVSVIHISQPSRQNVGIKRAIRNIRRKPNSLCRVDLMRPNGVPHSRSVASRSVPVLRQSTPLPSPRSRSQLSREERRKRRQLRRSRNQRQSSSPSNNSLPIQQRQQQQRQPANDMPNQWSPAGHNQHQQTQQMDHFPYNQ